MRWQCARPARLPSLQLAISTNTESQRQTNTEHDMNDEGTVTPRLKPEDERQRRRQGAILNEWIVNSTDPSDVGI
jgi:hypothetical protein